MPISHGFKRSGANSSMRALVTGACGFVGDHLARHLLESGDEVVGTVFQRNLSEKRSYRTEWVDVSDPKAVSRLLLDYRPDIVYHLAGIAFVPEAEEDFERTLRVNVLAVHNLAQTLHIVNSGSKVVLVSSAEVYGRISPEELPISERTALRPTNAYSLSKVMAEEVLWRFVREGRVNGVVLRPFNHIGPGQNERFVASSFARQLALIKKGKAEPILSVGNLSPQRDFADVRDVVRCYRLAGLKGTGTYNIASGRSISIERMLGLLVEVSGLSIEIRKDSAKVRGNEVAEIIGSYKRAEEELGWKPEIPIEKSLRDIFEWWQARV